MAATDYKEYDLTTLRQWKAEALGARHKLNVGMRTVSLGQGANRVEFQQTESARLDAYIADLNAAIAAKERGGSATSHAFRVGM
ncbi:MAG: hypothetical protein EPN21_13280 [Methylococcaceae bacterium]|nr:MAG: hypothetical protein EPN21_13280 [Methylococcaceae bacterium]